MASVIIDLIPPNDMRDLIEVDVLESSLGQAGPYIVIDTITEIGVYPEYVDQVTTENATSDTNWFMVHWKDVNNVVSQESTPVQGGTIVSEIMASLDDINAQLDGSVIRAKPGNTALIQISVARIIRGYLSRVISLTDLTAWSTPAVTPEIIREIAGKLIASQLYINRAARSTTNIDAGNLGQKLYDDAIALLQQILAGNILIDEVTVVDDTSSLTALDFFPLDATDRSFTRSMEL